MSIPEAQLETRCNQGATVTSAAAYTSIKTALADAKSKVRDLNPEIFLQGSYGNSTNIYADSDVDVVVQHNYAYYWDISALPMRQQMLFAQIPKVDHAWRKFYDPVVESLQSYFGAASVEPGNKAILVKLGLFCRRGYLDEELIWQTFGFYAVRWWAACRNYILVERKTENDSTLFVEFESLANRLHKRDRRAKLGELADAEINAFLQDETKL